MVGIFTCRQHRVGLPADPPRPPKWLDSFQAEMLNRPVQPGRVAQMGERGVRNAEVEGSIPFSSTKLHPKKSTGFH